MQNKLACGDCGYAGALFDCLRESITLKQQSNFARYIPEALKVQMDKFTQLALAGTSMGEPLPPDNMESAIPFNV